MKKERTRSCLRWAVRGLLGIIGLCLGLGIISALINQGMPQHSAVVERLSEADKARLVEINHLRKTQGDAVFPGWSQAEIPLIIYNEQYAFLVGYPEPPAGWKKVPQGTPAGGPWEIVGGDTWQGQPYYRLRLPAGQDPQSFIVWVGDRYTASLTTFDWFKLKLAEMFRESLPGFIRPVFPYPLVTNLYLGSSDQYMTTFLHEAAHAYQAMQSPAKLAAAETDFSRLHEQYPWSDADFNQAWSAELDCLRDGVRSTAAAETRKIVRRCLDLRTARRSDARLSDELVTLEREREWEEGLAKYAEMSIYRLAATTPGYQPSDLLAADPEFKGYRTYEQRWQNEVNQISLSGRQEGETRFYYSGMAQAMLLDRLMPGWKDRLFMQAIWLDDLLAEAVK